MADLKLYGVIMDLWKNRLTEINPLNLDIAAAAKHRLDILTKPPGSLGVLEECAEKYLAARGDISAKITKPVILTFAADHGVAEEGVSAFPQEVTPQMVANFANGGAAINVLAKHAGAKLKVIDIGVACDVEPFLPPNSSDMVICQKIAPGTANIAKGPAMTTDDAAKAIEIGMKIAEKEIASGSTLIGTGDMGIANTTPSAALYSAFLGIPPDEIAGRGTGIDDQRLKHKIEIIKRALVANRDSIDKGDTLEILAALGGFEIAGICGAILGAAAKRVPVVIDGFISGAAAVTAIQFNHNVIDYCFFSHLSAEAGHIKAMKKLAVKPLLDLNLRLGEGTGAALAFNIIEAGVKIINEMATFENAGVSGEK
jgi:nicotinate-nucleotide--dimethylbenzimidazole phosphoribosyltransferase